MRSRRSRRHALSVGSGYIQSIYSLLSSSVCKGSFIILNIIRGSSYLQFLSSCRNFLKISWRSPLFNSSRHLATPLFVDWLPTGQWSAVGSAVLIRGSMLSHCRQGGAADNPNLEAAKDFSRISSVFFLNSCC